MPLHQRVICSTISFRRLALDTALRQIADLGFSGTDLGALPGVCDHVPYELTADAVGEIAAAIRESGLAVRSINADVGDLNRPLDSQGRTARDRHLEQLVELAVQIGAPAIVLPCGSQGHEPFRHLADDIRLVADELRHAARIAATREVEVWVESQHSGRLCFDLDRAEQLSDALTGSGVRSVLDFSHVVASGDDLLTWIDRLAPHVAHVHIRDARRGDIHLSPGNGEVDFATAIDALTRAGYEGDFSLELETADVDDAERPAAAARAGRLISSYLWPADDRKTSMELTLSTQRTAVVTGAGSPRGLGRAAARRYAREGWAVVVADLDAAAAEATAAVIAEESAAPVFAHPVDVTSAESVSVLHSAVQAAGLPPVGAVATIAGIADPTPFLELTPELWERVFAVNSTGTFLTVRAFVPDMIEHGYGRIVTMSSVSAQQGGGVFSKTPYSAAKAAVLGFTRSIARELAPYGITCNSVSPGAADTDIRVGATDTDREAALSASVPLGRQATPDDIAALFVFLSSEDASYITGTTQNINGGAYIA